MWSHMMAQHGVSQVLLVISAVVRGAAMAATTGGGGVAVADYAQCGGSGYSGPTHCANEYSGTQCVYYNDWWSACTPAANGNGNGNGNGGGGGQFYNLQLYGWRVQSALFQDNTCGNHWLDFYNACSNGGYFPGGIGSCGSWGATVDRMQQCGEEGGGGTVTSQIHADFCNCMQCTFVPAASSTSSPYEYLDAQSCSGVPSFDDVVLQLTDEICGSRECGSASDPGPAVTHAVPLATQHSPVVTNALAVSSHAPIATDSSTGVADYGQCGGNGYAGPTRCANEAIGAHCVYYNDWWSACEPADTDTNGDDFYNLQLYGWRIQSTFFDGNACGNRWLDFYNACSNGGYFPGGIGFCGNWGSTVDRMQQCGIEDGNGTITEQIRAAFCSCLQCTFVPAATNPSTPYEHLDATQESCSGVPRFEDTVLQLVDSVCGSRDCVVVPSSAPRPRPLLLLVVLSTAAVVLAAVTASWR